LEERVNKVLPCHHHPRIYYFQNNIIITNIHFGFFDGTSRPTKKKSDVYFSTGNKGVDDEASLRLGFALTIRGHRQI